MARAMLRNLGALLALLVVLAWGMAGAALAQSPDLVLKGVISGADHQTYREISFRVPAGVERITVEFSYTGRDEKTTIDLGVRDPQRFRGWSGGNKARFTISAEDATPSYLPGPIVAGTWRLVLGVPNIRKTSHATYEARVWFDRRGQFSGFVDRPLKAPAGWYRGDLHSHTGNSDGACQPRGKWGSTDGKTRTPCPVFRTAETAAERELDFIAITDHNATSQYEAMRELQGYFDSLLLIPGREITTFYGHANVFGPTAFIDFQVGSAHAPTINDVIAQVAARGGVFSVNHPKQPSGESCMGCGWTAAKTDWSKVTSIEVVNGGSMNAVGGQAETAFSGIPFWEDLLNQGYRLTGVGGSDNHDADLPLSTASAIGRPTTVIWAQNLSQPALLDGLKSGRVFIDLDSVPSRRLEFSAEAGGRHIEMGGALPAAGPARFSVHVTGVSGGRVEVVENGRPLTTLALARLADDDETRMFDLPAQPAKSWVRVNVRNAEGRLVLVGNPIYLNR